MDLGRWDGETQATTDLLAATALDLGDFFALRSERARDLDDVPEGAAVRYRVRAELAGRLFEDVIVDVGFSPGPPPRVDTVHAFDLLDFADIVGVDVPVIPLARHLAEKVHAFTRTYGDGRTSTRVKDLVDMVLVALSCSLEGAEVREALETTFAERSSHALPNVSLGRPASGGAPTPLSPRSSTCRQPSTRDTALRRASWTQCLGGENWAAGIRTGRSGWAR
jgi:hypothetical protein